MSPGLLEIVNDAAHELLAGHAKCGDDAGGCCGGGCTPASADCACCITVAVVAPSMSTEVRAPDHSLSLIGALPDRDGPRGVHAELERPPRA